jgi:potassium-dependent mechanosensitive channel
MDASRRIAVAHWQNPVGLFVAGFVICVCIDSGLCPLRAAEPVVAKSAAQPKPAAKSEADVLSPEFIAARLKELEGASDADTPDKLKLVELYHAAADDLKHAAEHETKAAEFDKKLSTAAARIETLQCEMAQGSSAEKPLAQNAPLSAWEQRLADVEQHLAAARKTLAAKDEEPQRRGRRRAEIPPAITEARTALEELSTDGAVTNEEALPISQAKRAKHEARRKSLEAEIQSLEKELQWYDGPAAEVIKLESETTAQAVADLEKTATELREAVNTRRRAETARQADEAHLAAVTADSSVRRLADENSALADERKQLAEQLAQLGGESETVRHELDNLRDEYKRIIEKVKAAGLTNPVGQMLRKQRSGLASAVKHRRAIDQRHDEISVVQLKLFDLEEQLAALRDLRSQAREICNSQPEAAAIGPDDLLPLLRTRREYLESLQNDYDDYFRKLVEVDTDQRLLVKEATEYRSFIDERVLWIRSADAVSPADAKKGVGAISWLSSPANWWNALRSAQSQATHEPVMLVATISIFAVVLLTRQRIKRAIAAWATPTSDLNVGSSSLRRAVKTALATLLIAVPTPALLCTLGWFISCGGHVRDEFSEAFGESLQVTAMVLLPLLVARQICRRDGLAEAHFGWPGDALVTLRRQLSWLTTLGAPLVAIVAMLEAQANEAWKESLGRSLFLATQVILTGFLFRSLRPPHGSLHKLLVMRPGSWLERLSSPLYLVLLAVPVTVGGLAAAGYYYTALRLAWRFELTLWLVIGLVVVQSLLGRWLTAVYRRLAIESAIRVAGSTPQGMSHWQPTSKSNEPLPVVETPPEVDLEKVDLQTKRLLHSISVVGLVFGLGWVWSEVLPALQIFNQVTLIAGEKGAADVTLANLFNAMIAAAMTVVAVNNLPGLLEAAILHRLPLDAGVRYAIAAVVRYAIGITGITIAAGAVGVGWPKVQWLVAAVTFGLGFGLQEIFANFVSGLIVLFERPIRVGDTITVGDVTGVVSRIRMRATTITDWDRKELIVPNKEFITAKLVNWTLSDPVSRIIIPIGIAYGSDTEQARRLLLKVASTTRHVLREPPAKAFFMGFGESSLNFELRTFVANVDQRTNVLHELNMAIDRTFREAGIEIAFPQRDLHIRSVDGVPAAENPVIQSLSGSADHSNQSRNAA